MSGPTQHIRFTCNDPETGAEEPIESSYDLQYWTAATRNVRHRDSFRLILKAHVTIQDEPPARDPETPAPETAGTAELPITVDDNLSPEPVPFDESTASMEEFFQQLDSHDASLLGHFHGANQRAFLRFIDKPPATRASRALLFGFTG